MDAVRAPGRPAPENDAKQVQKETARFVVAGTLAELPAMFGLVYAMLGGDNFHGLLLAAAGLVATMLLKPE